MYTLQSRHLFVISWFFSLDNWRWEPGFDWSETDPEVHKCTSSWTQEITNELERNNNLLPELIKKRAEIINKTNQMNAIVQDLQSSILGRVLLLILRKFPFLQESIGNLYLWESVINFKELEIWWAHISKLNQLHINRLNERNNTLTLMLEKKYDTDMFTNDWGTTWVVGWEDSKWDIQKMYSKLPYGNDKVVPRKEGT